MYILAGIYLGLDALRPLDSTALAPHFALTGVDPSSEVTSARALDYREAIDNLFTRPAHKDLQQFELSFELSQMIDIVLTQFVAGLRLSEMQPPRCRQHRRQY
ncbi:hypothetical protein NP233_g5335 [Leucocoprinus birnbaumii]|uniref:Uncharacterized protein n=1 Tax=Leucocoprinus birnbaumii TaxID=56174 RepID=A0AAD5VUG4_9AGAR|nr:hypothetical protein NP233_g5335 [Leucocoprinus birnbaumii]